MLVEIRPFDNKEDAEEFAMERANFDGLYVAILPKVSGKFMTLCYSDEPKHFTEGNLADKVEVFMP